MFMLRKRHMVRRVVPTWVQDVGLRVFGVHDKLQNRTGTRYNGTVYNPKYPQRGGFAQPDGRQSLRKSQKNPQDL